jgi:hypothetical protein
MLCALATHAFVYRTLWPSDGVHGYFGWYEPAVAAASLAAVAILLGFLAVALLARHVGRPLRVRPAPQVHFAVAARSLALASLSFLLTQETLERSVEAGRPALATFRPSEWVTVLAGIALVSMLLTAARMLGRGALRRALSAPGVVRPAALPVGWSVVTSRVCSRRPLAPGSPLRGPPRLLLG